MRDDTSTYLDVKVFLAELEAEGCRIEVDGWQPRLTGTRPSPERMRQILGNKLPVVYHIVATAVHRCETCGGYGRVSFEHEHELHWFCTPHEPVSHGLFLLWEAACQKEIYTREIDRLRENHDSRLQLLKSFEAKRDYWATEYEALEGQLALA